MTMTTYRNLLSGANSYTAYNGYMVGAGTNSAYYTIVSTMVARLEAGITYTLSCACANVNEEPSVYHWGRYYNGSRTGCVSVGINLASAVWTEYWICGSNDATHEWVYRNNGVDTAVQGARILPDGRLAFTFTPSRTADYVLRFDAYALQSAGNTTGAEFGCMMIERGSTAHAYVPYKKQALPYSTNLLHGANDYTEQTPLSLSQSAVVNSVYADLKAGQSYTLSFETNGQVGYGRGDEWVACGMKFLQGAIVSMQNDATGLIFTFTPSQTGRFALVVSTTGDIACWNFQLEKGEVAHDYTPNLDDLSDGNGRIKIYSPSGAALLFAPLLSDAVWSRTLMGTDTIKLSWVEQYDDTEDVLRLPLGAYVLHNNETYRLIAPHTPKQSDEATYQYEAVFHSEISALTTKPFFFYMTIDGEEQAETDWNLNGEFVEFTQALTNAIAKSTGQNDWTVTAPTDLGTQSLSFSRTTIFDALGQIATAFDCEWKGTGRTIQFFKDTTSVTDTQNVRRLVVGTDIKTPQRQTGDETYYNRYYAFGSTRNIVRSDYGSLHAAVTSLAEPRLKLPRVSWYDEETEETIESCPHGYVDYDDGTGADHTEKNAKVLIYEDIYPQADLKISAINITTKKTDSGEEYPVYALTLATTAGNSTFSINTTVYNKDTNASGHLISGLNVSIHFKTGLMQGKEFEVAVGANGATFTIVPDTSEEIMVPNTIIVPQVGDELIIFNIRMPDNYRLDAEHRLYRKLLEDIAKEHSQYVAMTIESNPCGLIDSLALTERVEIINGQSDIVTRIVGIEQNLDIPTIWSITTGEAVRTSRIRAMTAELSNLSGGVELSQKTSVLATRQAYKASQEVINQIFDPEGDFFTDMIKPLVVQTANVTVGTKSQQLVLENVRLDYQNVKMSSTPQFVFGKINTLQSAYLRHYAIDPDNVRSWRFSDTSKVYQYGGTSETTLGHSFAFSASTGGCYLYAVCQRYDDSTDPDVVLNATFLLTDQQILSAPDNDTANYYFLLGFLSSEITTNGIADRTITASYGQTTINGRYITSGRLQSADGDTYFDLDTGEISGKITFTSANRQEITNIATTAATDAVSDIEIGGRNLLQLNSSKWVVGSFNPSTGALADNAYRIRTNYRITVESGQSYQISNFDTTFYWVLYFYTTEETYLSTYSLTSWQTARKKTWTAPYNGYVLIGIRYSSSNTATIYTSAAPSVRVKIEKGTVATDWSLAPEDIVTDVKVGGRNYIRNSKTAVTETPGDNVSHWASLSSLVLNKQMTEDDAKHYVWWSYFVDNWTRSDAPSPSVNLGGASSSKRWGWATDGGRNLADAGYIQISETTRRYWQKIVVPQTYYLFRCAPYFNASEYTDGDAPSSVTIYNLMLTFGTTLEDYAPAPEDFDDGITAAQTSATAAQTAANSAINTLNAMNGDDVFSVIEKKSFRPEWETISSRSNTNTGLLDSTGGTMTGGYHKVYNAAISAGVGVDDLNTAVYNLRTYLNDKGLYTNVNTSGFSQAMLGTHLTAYYNEVERLWNAIANALATQKANAVEQKVDAIEIGGRNLLGKHNFDPTWVNVAWGDNGVCTGVSADNRTWNYSYGNHRVKLSAGTYTLSLWGITSTTSSYANSCFFLSTTDSNDGQGNGYWLGFPSAGEKTVRTFTITADRYFSLIVKAYDGSYKVQLEKGNKSTDWTAAPEDVAADIEAAEKEALKAQLIAAAAPNLWPDRYFEHTDLFPAFGTHSSAGVRIITGRDNVLAYDIPYVAGHVYLVDFWYMVKSGSASLNASLWWQGQTSGNAYDGYNSNVNDESEHEERWGVVTYIHRKTLVKCPSSVVKPTSFRPFLQIEQNAGTGTTEYYIRDYKIFDYTAEQAAKEYEYLAQSLQEATTQTTDIDGGLVLSSFIGVRDNDGNVGAGMTATSLASGTGEMPMIFAGRTAGTNELGTFRVYKDGRVQSVSESDTTNFGEFDDGLLRFYLGNQVKNVITSSSMGSITDSLANLLATSYGQAQSVAVNLQSTATQSYNGSDVSGTGTGTKLNYEKVYELLPSQSMAGKFHTDAALVVRLKRNVKNATVNGYDVGVFSGGLTTIFLAIQDSAGATIATASETISSNADEEKSVTLPAVSNYSLTAGRQVYLKIAVTMSAPTAVIADYIEGQSYSVSHDVTVLGFASITGRFVASYYKDTMYADGLLMSSASNRYFAIDPQARDGRSLAWAHGDAAYKMTGDGLQWRQAGSGNMYRANPLVGIIKVTYNSASTNGYYGEFLYNPLSKEAPSVSRTAKGELTLTHNLGITTYVAQAQEYINTSHHNGRFIAFYDPQEVSIKIRLSWNGNAYDMQNAGDYFMVFLFDYSNY